MSTARAMKFFPAYFAHGRARAATVGTLRRSLTAMVFAMAAAFAGLLAAPVQAQAPALQLQDMQVQTLPGNKIELELKLSGPAPAPLSFTIDNPARISLDLPNTAIALPSRRREVGAGPLSTILAAESGGRTRVVLNLDTMVPYETRVSGNSVFVTLGSAGAGATFARSTLLPSLSNTWKPASMSIPGFTHGAFPSFLKRIETCVGSPE